MERAKGNAELFAKAYEMFEANDLFVNGRKSLYDKQKAVDQMKSILKELKEND